MFVAVVAGLAAGALWALAFIAPGLVHPFAAADLTLVRYAVFGVSSAVVLAVWPNERWRPIAKAHWRSFLLLALTGNTLYYLMLSEALQRAGTLLPTLVIGTLPVVMAFLGGVRRGRFSMRRLAIPAALILAGLIVHVGVPISLTDTTSSPSALIGLGLAFAALASWAFYGVRNAELLGANQGVDIVAWTALTGIATLVTLLPFAAILPGQGSGLLHSGIEDLAPLLFWGLVLGLLSSWLATWFWNQASRTLSSELLGYLIVSETVFAILYGFLLERRPPTGTELLSTGLLILGVVIGIRSARRALTASRPITTS